MPGQDEGIKELYEGIRDHSPHLLVDAVSWLGKYRVNEHPDVPNPLPIPYQSQRDNFYGPARTCFSSACAMMLMGLKPGIIYSDDEYLREVLKHGDSPDPAAQVAALAHFGITARLKTDATKSFLVSQLKLGISVPCGFLHHGVPAHPTGGGHWLDVIGWDDTGVWVHDSWGEAILDQDAYAGTNGSKLHYSDKNWTNTRWQVEGPGHGYAIEVLEVQR